MSNFINDVSICPPIDSRAKAWITSLTGLVVGEDRIVRDTGDGVIIRI